MAHRTDVKVRFYELDPYGHLNHSVFVQFYETGRVELLEEIGLGLDKFREMGYQFVVTGIETEFLRTVHAGEVITVETEVLQLRRASSIWLQRLWRGDELVSRQRLRAAITDPAGKPVRAPDFLAGKLEPFFAAP